MPNPTRAARPSAYVAVNGARIRRLRTDLGLSLSQFARQIGVSQPYMTQIEVGRVGTPIQRVSPAVFRRLCDALEVRPDELRVEDEAA